MRKILCVLALVVTCLTGATGPAQADTRRCASPGEYAHVHKGMTKRRVHAILGVSGGRVAFARQGRYTSEVRRYRGCPRRSAVSVAYGNGRVRSKSAIWRRG